MRLSLNGRTPAVSPETLADLAPGESATLSGFDLPEADAHRLMELGFLPGTLVTAARTAPGGDPRVYRVEGTEFALRGETARRMRVEATRGEAG